MSVRGALVGAIAKRRASQTGRRPGRGRTSWFQRIENPPGGHRSSAIGQCCGVHFKNSRLPVAASAYWSIESMTWLADLLIPNNSGAGERILKQKSETFVLKLFGLYFAAIGLQVCVLVSL